MFSGRHFICYNEKAPAVPPDIIRPDASRSAANQDKICQEVSIMNNGKIRAISVSPERGTLKKEIEECMITPQGLEGDGHAGDWSRQITCLSYESLLASNEKHGLTMGPGDMAENILIEGLDLSAVTAGDRIRLGEEAVIEVSQVGKPDHPSIVTKTFGTSLLPHEGLFCRVITPGKIHRGDAVSLMK